MYCKIDRKIWNDQKFRRLSEPAKFAFLYFLCSPHGILIPGAFRSGKATIAADLNWTTEKVEETIIELSRNCSIRVDLDAQLVWLPNAIKYNLPSNPNVLTGWGKFWNELPECELRQQIWQNYRVICEAVIRNKPKQNEWLKALAEGFPELSAIPLHIPSSNSFETLGEPTETEIDIRNSNSSSNSSSILPLAFARSKNRPPASSTSDKNQLIQAAQFVTQELNLAGRDMYRLIENVIALELSQSTETPQAIAEMLVRCRRSYDAAPHAGNFIWPVKQFFEQGIWKQSQLWKRRSNGIDKASERLERNIRDVEQIIQEREDEEARQPASDDHGDLQQHQFLAAGQKPNPE